MSMAQVLKLKPAFSDEQAEALAGLFDEEAATRRDLALVTADLEKFRVEVRAGFDRANAELKAEIEKLRLEVQRDLKGVEARLVAWLFGQGLAVVGILFALIRFMDR